MKQCASCKEVKPRSEFWRQAAQIDGLHSYCKACMRANCRKRYLTLRSTERYKEQRRRNQRRYAASHPEASTAHSMAHNRQIDLKKDACEQCGAADGALHMHHPDHGKPLEVVTLCIPCHETAHHGELR
jgi:hypothetical protein